MIEISFNINLEELVCIIKLNLFNTVGVLGLCAIVLSSPYDIPIYVPDTLMLLCEHSHDPDLIQVSIFQSTMIKRYKSNYYVEIN